MARNLHVSVSNSKSHSATVSSRNTQPCTTHLYTAQDHAVSNGHGRRFLSGALLSCAMFVASGNVFASDEEVKDNTAAGVGIGAVVGTLAGGPFGFIAGSVIGGYIGEGQGYKGSAKNSNVQHKVIAAQEVQINNLENRLAKSEKALASATQNAQLTKAEQITQIDRVSPIAGNMQGLSKDFSLSLILQFRFGQSDIEPMYRNQLAQLGEFLKQHSQVVATITGFTDAVGASKPNLSLSQRRAESAQTILRGQGVNADQLLIVGKGENAPLYEADSPQTRFFERRVLIELAVR